MNMERYGSEPHHTDDSRDSHHETDDFSRILDELSGHFEDGVTVADPRSDDESREIIINPSKMPVTTEMLGEMGIRLYEDED